MKKQYANPTLEVVFIEDADIVTESLEVKGRNDGGIAGAKRRGGDIWGEGDE